MTHPKRATHASIIAAMAFAAQAGLDLGSASRRIAKRFDEAQEADEEQFLKTLHGEPLRIWTRRIARGLTREELTFIRERKE